jgi:hypothetical protein
VELLDLLYETGADLRCFAHTRDEIRGVLEACASQVQTSDAEATPAVRYCGTPIDGVLQDRRHDAVQRSGKDLEALRIRAVEKPTHAEHEHQIGEDAFREELRGPSTTRYRSRSSVTSTLYRPSCVCAGEDVLSDWRSVEPCS